MTSPSAMSCGMDAKRYWPVPVPSDPPPEPPEPELLPLPPLLPPEPPLEVPVPVVPVELVFVVVPPPLLPPLLLPLPLVLSVPFGVLGVEVELVSGVVFVVVRLFDVELFFTVVPLNFHELLDLYCGFSVVVGNSWRACPARAELMNETKMGTEVL